LVLLALRFSAIILLLSFSACSHFFYHPDSNMYYPPDKNGFRPEDVLFQSGDQTQLHGWFFRAVDKKPLGTIVQFHGNAENISSHYASLVWLTKQGYNLFIFDYRGYGKSSGKPDQEGLYKDGMAALDKAWEFHQKTKAKKFIVYGQSLGGIVAMRSFVDFRHQDETYLVVMDSTFPSYQDIAQQKLASFWLTWLLSPLGQVLVSDEYASEDVLKTRFKAPLLVIHDKRDRVIDFKNGEEIFKIAQSPQKEFWQLDKGRHVGVFAIDTPENRERFLNRLDGTQK